jgi:hypothetical protein
MHCKRMQPVPYCQRSFIRDLEKELRRQGYARYPERAFFVALEIADRLDQAREVNGHEGRLSRGAPPAPGIAVDVALVAIGVRVGKVRT